MPTGVVIAYSGSGCVNANRPTQVAIWKYHGNHLTIADGEFITLAAGVAAWPMLARAQQPFQKLWRLGVLETNSRASNSANFDAFQKEMDRLGYVEGKNLIIEYRSVDGRAERYSELAAELVRLKTDAILTRGTPATRAARDASATTPVVMTAVARSAY